MKKLISLLISLLSWFSLETEQPTQTTILPEVVIHGKTFDQEIFDISLEMGADTLMAKMIVAQALVESDDFTNRLTVNHNNVFSMQHPSRRKTTSLGALATAEGRPNTYASYRSIRDAVGDLFLYFKARKIDLRQPSITKYVKLLKKKRFFEETELKYRNALKKKFNQVTV